MPRRFRLCVQLHRLLEQGVNLLLCIGGGQSSTMHRKQPTVLGNLEWNLPAWGGFRH